MVVVEAPAAEGVATAEHLGLAEALEADHAVQQLLHLNDVITSSSVLFLEECQAVLRLVTCPILFEEPIVV